MIGLSARYCDGTQKDVARAARVLLKAYLKLLSYRENGDTVESLFCSYQHHER